MKSRVLFIAWLAALAFCWTAARATPVLTLGSASGAPGDDVAVTVTVSNISKADFWGLKIDYDSSRLNYVSTEAGSAIKDWGIFDADRNGHKITLDAFAGPSGTPISGDKQELCVLNFTIKKSATGTARLTPGSPAHDLKRASLNPGKITSTKPLPLSLSIGSASGNVGTTVTVTASATSLSESTAWSFKLSFDPSRLSVVSVVKGKATSSWEKLEGALDGKKLEIEADAGEGTAISGADQELCKITFKILKGSGGKVKLKPGSTELGLNGAKLYEGQIKIN